MLPLSLEDLSAVLWRWQSRHLAQLCTRDTADLLQSYEKLVALRWPFSGTPVFGRHVVTMLWLIPFTHWNLGASHDFKENRAKSKSLCNSWASHPYPYNGKNSNHLEIIRMTHFHHLQCKSPQAQWHLWFQLWVMCGFIQQPAFCRISGYQVAILHIVGWFWLRFSLTSFWMLLIWAKISFTKFNLVHLEGFP